MWVRGERGGCSGMQHYMLAVLASFPTLITQHCLGRNIVDYWRASRQMVQYPSQKYWGKKDYRRINDADRRDRTCTESHFSSTRRGEGFPDHRIRENVQNVHCGTQSQIQAASMRDTAQSFSCSRRFETAASQLCDR